MADEKTQAAKTEDRRVRRTKKLLQQGLTELMERKPVKDITVRELADLTDLNRGTFYMHYRDVFDMLEQMEQELFAQFDSLLASHEGDRLSEEAFPLLRDLFGFIGENAAFCRAMLDGNGDMAFLLRLNDVLKNRCLRDWMMARSREDKNRFDYSYAFAVYGCAGMIRDWLNKGMPESPDRLAEIAAHMIQHGAV